MLKINRRNTKIAKTPDDGITIYKAFSGNKKTQFVKNTKLRMT